MTDVYRVNRVVNLLANNHSVRRFHRYDLSVHLSDSLAFVSLRDMTRLWPRIEAGLVGRGLFAVRPAGILSYGVMASSDPLLGYLSLNRRERSVVTRMRNDRAGRMLHAIAASGGEVGGLAAGQLERIQAYIRSFEESGTSTFTLDLAAMNALQRIPFGTFRRDLNYINNSNGMVAA